MSDAVIVAAARTPIGTARKGTLLDVTTFELARYAAGEALKRSGIPTGDVDDIMVRFRKDPALTGKDGAAAMARAAAAIARAQERLPDMFRSPLPPPCSVEPMPPHMARFGAPPYYAPPARDGRC